MSQGSADEREKLEDVGANVSTVLLNVRIPKTGSESVSEMLSAAFLPEHRFYLPNTLDFDGRVSRYQRRRFVRRQRWNLRRAYKTASMDVAIGLVAAKARPGALIYGGHIDFRAVAARIPHLKMITMLRDPASRSLSEYNYARQTYLARNPLRRLTAPTLPKICGTRSFDGYLDFLIENADVYANFAAQYVGWDGAPALSSFFETNVFHAGVLENNRDFAERLSQKLGRRLSFPSVNRTERRSEEKITALQRSRIEKLSPRDFELYEWVRSNP
jgi:hypothetical protein